MLERDYEVEDGYTAETDIKTLAQYLASALDPCYGWENYKPDISDPSQYSDESLYYSVVKKGYE